MYLLLRGRVHVTGVERKSSCNCRGKRVRVTITDSRISKYMSLKQVTEIKYLSLKCLMDTEVLVAEQPDEDHSSTEVGIMSLKYLTAIKVFVAEESDRSQAIVANEHAGDSGNCSQGKSD